MHHPHRIPSIDIVRGLVMVIMALDHTRDLIHTEALKGDPTTIPGVSAGLFFTRWVTHLCAPTFVFLSGVSAWLSYQKSQNATATRRFLFSRGIWLLILEFTIVGFGIWFDIQFRTLMWQVIAAIGFGFLILSLCFTLRPKTILIIAIIGMLLLNTLAVLPQQTMQLPVWAQAFISVQVFPFSPDRLLIISYPPLSWALIILLGYGAAPYFKQAANIRSSFFLKTGIILLMIFIALRFINKFGDPQLWSTQEELAGTIMSFVNVSKYPPSLQFLCCMLGLMFVLLYIFEKNQNKFSNILRVYGTVPLFYYIIHWYVIHLLLFAILFAQGFGIADFNFRLNFGRPDAPNGLPLWGVYIIWVLVVVVLYPICTQYSRYKHTHPEKKMLRYL
ncbi:hypothetical protein PIECOFPK_02613 [Mycovorax composti]|jgi:Predicted membrane protein|uniref:Heparan-alpha-glucosaminide N-acetyltransferase catalytic domain-containing protein n=1 Tax=Mycovorax composti TaxID=2962693 RepID=A0ABZ2ENP7_9BACT